MKKNISIMMLVLSIQSFATAQNYLLATNQNNTVISNRNNGPQSFRFYKTYTSLQTDSTRTPIKDHAYYMKKSRNKKTAAWVLLGGGVAVAGVGLIIGANRNASFDDAATGGIIAAVGLLSALGSIPSFISSGINKHKAKLALGNKRTGIGLPANFSGQITGITMSIPIGK